MIPQKQKNCLSCRGEIHGEMVVPLDGSSADPASALRHSCAAPAPLAVFCCKQQIGMSLLDGRCVQHWSSAQRADQPPDRQQHTSHVGRCKSSLGSTCPVSPRHIPSQTHSPQLAARISAGFFAQPAAGVAGVAAGRLLRLASSRCTSSRWCLFSSACNGSRHGICTASERRSHTPRLASGLPQFASVDSVGPHA